MQVCLRYGPRNKWMEGVDAEEMILMKMNCSFSRKVDEALVVFVPRLDLIYQLLLQFHPCKT